MKETIRSHVKQKHKELWREHQVMSKSLTVYQVTQGRLTTLKHHELSRCTGGKFSKLQGSIYNNMSFCHFQRSQWASLNSMLRVQQGKQNGVGGVLFLISV